MCEYTFHSIGSIKGHPIESFAFVVTFFQVFAEVQGHEIGEL
jgi:hypothetical protein